MNGKTAKKLRAITRAATVGLPAVAYMAYGQRDKMTGKEIPLKLAKCTKSEYKKLKRLFKKAR